VKVRRGRVIHPISSERRAKVQRTEVQLAYDCDLLNCAVFRLDFIEGMSGGVVYGRRVQRRALGE
jgi:hypothetical protein